MFADEHPADGYQGGPDEGKYYVPSVVVRFVALQEDRGAHRESECIGGMCREESVETAPVLQYVQSAPYHRFAVAWPESRY